MPPRKPKVRPRTKMEHDRQRFRVLYREYTIERLKQWYEEDCRSPPKRGRRPVKWFMPLSEPVRAKAITDRTPQLCYPKNIRTKPPRRKAHKKI
jgi:hypothetical protein